MRLTWTVLALIGCIAGCGGGADERPSGSASDDISAHADPYANEPANLELWLDRLEVGSRELYSARSEVADAIELRDGARVADVGAGTGVYTFLFAERVGRGGVVYAVDIEPRFLTLINQRAKDLGVENVVAVMNREDSLTLPASSVDVVFLSDTYHYFSEPEAMLRSIFEALRPGGSLYVVDYDLPESDTPPPEKRHVRAGRTQVAEEIEGFGFGSAEIVTPDELSENYMLKFRRPE